MTQPNPPVAPHGSVESYLEMFRSAQAEGLEVHPYAFGVVCQTASTTGYSDKEKVRRINNVDAAVKVIEEENRERYEASRRTASAVGMAYSRADSEPADPTPPSGGRVEPHTGAVVDGGALVPVEAPSVFGLVLTRPGSREAAAVKPIVSDETIAEAQAMAERDRVAGGPPWEVPAHPDNALPGGWHRGQIR